MARLAAVTCVLAGLLASASALAKPKGLRALSAPDEVSLDGLPDEFDTDWRDLDHTEKGSAKKGDISAKATIAYDASAIYIAADVNDDKLAGGGDHVELLLGIPGGTVVSFGLYPGEPGKSRASVKEGGRKVGSAQIVEAPRKGGYSLEAKIPWEAIPKSKTIRVGYRGAIFVHDADSGTSVEAIVGTADTRKYAELPPISTAPELALGSGLLRERNIQSPPRYNLIADVVGDGLHERVLVYDRFMVVLGPGYRGGEQYYYRDLGTADVPLFKLSDITGDGRVEAILRRRIRGESGAVEVLEVLSYHDGAETPSSLFAHEVKLELDGGAEIVNDVEISGSGTATRITISAGQASGVDGGAVPDSSTGAAPILAPWGAVASQTFAVEDGEIVLASEKTKPSENPEPSVEAPSPRPASAPSPKPSSGSTKVAVWTKGSSGADTERVYALYKEQRKVTGDPRWDHNIDLVGGDEPERLVVHGRDLVVFGPGFRGGRGFSALTLSGFEDDDDIKSVTTRDIDRDGHHEIVVRGEIRTPLPEDLGEGDIHRQMVFVYKVKGEVLERVFAAEVGRRVGDNRIEGKITFLKKGKFHIELKPGRAVGYTEETYPWSQKTSPEDGVEPLLLPWGGVERVRLRYDGSAFSR
jgi:hypothetical protein